MPARCLLYYITDRNAFPGDELTRRRRLLEKIAEAVRAGVDYIQLREKDLPARELESLAREAVRIITELKTENQELRTALLINSRIDVALAVGADGAHLRSDDIFPEEARTIWSKAPAAITDHAGAAAFGCPAQSATGGGTWRHQTCPSPPLIGVSCHSPEEVTQAAANGASFAVFAPVFEKVVHGKKDAPRTHPAGLAQLEQACQANIPVLALGGVTLSNARSCLKAGAAGVAGIRLFQENDISQVAGALRQFVR
jgi:thiamine-phosphate pyrophosphorylase